MWGGMDRMNAITYQSTSVYTVKLTHETWMDDNLLAWISTTTRIIEIFSLVNPKDYLGQIVSFYNSDTNMTSTRLCQQ